MSFQPPQGKKLFWGLEGPPKEILGLPSYTKSSNKCFIIHSSLHEWMHLCTTSRLVSRSLWPMLFPFLRWRIKLEVMCSLSKDPTAPKKIFSRSLSYKWATFLPAFETAPEKNLSQWYFARGAEISQLYPGKGPCQLGLPQGALWLLKVQYIVKGITANNRQIDADWFLIEQLKDCELVCR